MNNKFTEQCDGVTFNFRPSAHNYLTIKETKH